MSSYFRILCAVYSVFTLLTITGAQEDLSDLIAAVCSTSQNNCPLGVGSGIGTGPLVCATLLALIYSSNSGCATYFGDAITLTDEANAVLGLITTENNVCDYYNDDTVVDNCYYPNDTLVSNLCFGIFPIIYNLRYNCSDFYTVDPCKITELGALAINNFVSPENNCVPAPYYDECQLKPSPNPPDYCPNCVVASCSSEASS